MPIIGSGLRKLGGLGSSSLPYAIRIGNIPNVIGYWKLNEASGNFADSSGSGYTLTPTNVTYANASGPSVGMGSAPTLNGSTSKIDFPAGFLSATNYRDEGAIFMWLKIASYASGQVALRFNDFQGSPNAYQLQLNLSNGTSFQFNRNGGDGTSKLIIYNPGSPAGWFNAGFRWSVSANTLDMLINGVIVGSGYTSGIVAAGTPALNSAQSLIGAATSTPTSVINGNMAHIVLMSRAPTTAESLIIGTAA